MTRDELYRAIVEGTHEAIVFADREGHVALWNGGAEEMFGYRADEVLGKSLEAIIPERLRARHDEGYRKVMATGSTRYGSELLAVPALRKDGTRISIEFTIVLVRDAAGEIAGTAALDPRRDRALAAREGGARAGALTLIQRLRTSNEWQFFGVLPRADAALAVAWWVVLAAARPPAGRLRHRDGRAGRRGAARRARSPGRSPLMGSVFVLLQVLAPIHHAVGANLGSRTAAWLYDRLTRACVRPPGLGHLENPKLTSDLTMARDFDLGISGPPLNISMDFIAAELVEMVGGLASACVLAAYAWWAPLLLAGAWLATHWLLRESAVWRDRETDEVRQAQRHADYAYRLAVDPPAAKELRLFGLADWTIERFRSRRRRLYELRWAATRLRERPVLWSLLLVLAANLAVFASLGARGARRKARARTASSPSRARRSAPA